jgi:hypothetical protein
MKAARSSIISSVSPVVYRLMRVIASMMSSTRSAFLRLDIGQGLADILRDAFHADTLQASRGQNVYFPPEQLFQILRETNKVVIRGLLKIDEKVQIALSVLSARRKGTEECNSPNRMLFEKLFISS